MLYVRVRYDVERPWNGVNPSHAKDTHLNVAYWFPVFACNTIVREMMYTNWETFKLRLDLIFLAFLVFSNN